MIYFFKWVQDPHGGNGGDQWVENHIESFVNIGGPMLGVPKAFAALLSGNTEIRVKANILKPFYLEL
jgi:phospholipid:diacylglycerol acyltransferase